MQQRFRITQQQLQAFWRQLTSNGIVQLVIAATMLLLGVLLLTPSLVTAQAKATLLQQQVAQQQQQFQQLEQQQANTQLQLQLELQSQRETQAALAQQHRNNAEMEKELAFFRSIMAPETIVDGVVIHDFALDETSDPRRFRYQLVLTQQKVRKRYAKGRVTVAVEGSLNNRAHRINLTELDQANPKFGYSFRYFQEFSGEINLPEAFIPERFSVSLNAKKNRGNSATYFPIAQLVSDDSLRLLNQIGG